MRSLAIIAILFVAACTPPQEAEGPALPVPPEIARAVEASMPGLTIVSGAADGEGEFEVTGTLDGQEYELDLLGPEGGWRVVEVQRDIAWGDAPQAVRDLIATTPGTFLPARVIESGQPADGSVVYLLFAPDAPASSEPQLSVRYFDGEASIMTPAH
jgi:hypothetical protein